MEILQIADIRIAPDRQRRLFDEVALMELEGSIEKFGLMHPVVVRPTPDGFQLVAGERRVKAVQSIFLLGGTVRYNGKALPNGAIPVVTLGELPAIEAEEAELDENLRRVDLTWQEHAAAVAKLSRLRNAQAAQRMEDPPTPESLAEEAFFPKREGFADGASDYGKQRIRKELVVAKYLDRPAVAAAKTVDEAFKIVKRQEELARSEELGRTVGQIFSRADHTCANGDSLELLTGLQPGFDVILTDPPYGMGADAFGTSDGKVIADEVHLYNDDEETFSRVVLPVLSKACDLTKPGAHAYVFCDIERFFALREFFRSIGWKPFRTPLVWTKPDGRVPLPQHGPRRTYELLCYAIRGGRPVRKVAPDVLPFPPDTNLNLAAQKPVGLFRELLSRSCLPGDSVLDPFCGTGTIFPAAHELKIRATGFELDPRTYGIAVKRIEDLQ